VNRDRATGAFWQWATVLALLAGVFLRWASLGPTSSMLHYDEAWNGVDALALLRQPRLTPFLPNNFGRESGWMYWLMPYLLALGPTAFAIRFSATVTGILTLAAAGRLGRELAGKRGAFWGVAALAVFYWHIHLSHLALRANLYVLIGTLAAAALLFACRVNSRRAWLVGGAALGLLGYTYFASAVWLGYIGVSLLGLAIFDRQRRSGSLTALLLAAVLLAPLALYWIGHPDQMLSRPSGVATLSQDALAQNAQVWLAAWFRLGDGNHEFNLPGRPILDLSTGILGGIGLLGATFCFRRRSYGVILIGWGAVACLPSLLSDQAPHFLRACGMTVPVALVVGAGGLTLENLIRRFIKVSGAALLPCLLLLPTGIAAYRDFHGTWMHHPDTFIVMEQSLTQAIKYVRDAAPVTNPVYFSPFTSAHPVILFGAGDLAPRPVAAFDSHQCLVLSDRPSDYVSLTMYEPGFQQRLAQWAAVTPLYLDPGSPASPRYGIFSATSYSDLGVSVASFDGLLSLRLMQPISATVAPGESLPIVLGVRPLRPLDFAPSLFLHLQGSPTPYEGGTLWAQADSQLCVSYPAHLWRTDETIVQSFTLTIPPETPAGDYVLATGIYPFPNGDRLPTPEGDPTWKYVVLHRLTVTAGQ